MRVFPRIAGLALLALAFAGCAAPSDRNSVLAELSPARMSAQAWSRVVGSYNGPVRLTTQRWGFEAQKSIETRVDIAGPVSDPEIFLRMDSGFSTEWSVYGEHRGIYTNIQSKLYGSQGTVAAATHAPNQLLLTIHRDGASPEKCSWLILTFRGRGVVDAEMIGHSGWRGDGEFWRIPTVLTPP